MAQSDDLSQKLWGQYIGLIAAQMGANAGANIQVLPAAQLLYGGSGNDFVTPVREFSEQVPNWGAAYSPSASSVVDAYQTILAQIQETATNGSSIETQYNNEKQKLSDLMGKASQYKVQQIKQWVEDKKEYVDAGIDAPSFNDWFKDNGQEEYDAMVAEQIHQGEVVSALLNAEGISSPLVQALASLNVALKANSDKANMPMIINPDAAMLSSWVKTPPNPATITLNDQTTQYDYSHSEFHEQSGTKLFGFISIGHRSVNSSQTNIFNSNESYGIQIDFAASGAFNLTQGDWFDGALLRNYKTGPWVKDSQFATGASQPYGQDGVFPLLAARIFVVMNPSITITQKTEESNQLFSSLQEHFSNGVSLGSFAFGGSDTNTSNIQQHTTTDASTMSIKITDTSNIPQIIAVVSDLMP